MSLRNYAKGIRQIKEGIYAYLQPDGSWGYSNAGLIVDGDQSLLIDTLFDLLLTQEMLETMAHKESAAAQINTLVITHANGDHFYGAELVEEAEIIASKACAEEMKETPPELLADLSVQASGLGQLGEFFIDCFGAFDFGGITFTPPTRTFEERLELAVGEKQVELLQVGPCHTKGDVMVMLPKEKVVFAADILFIGGHPIMWAGPVKNWIKACDIMLDMDVETIVPGHGPLTDKKGVQSIKDYWVFLENEAKKRFENGMTAVDAAKDIDLGPYKEWGETERIVVNVSTLFKEFTNDDRPANALEMFTLMSQFGKD